MGIGLGIHGEPGIDSKPLGTADEIAEMLVEGLLGDRPDESGSRVVALLNGLGSAPYEDLFIVYRGVARALGEAGIAPFIRSIGLWQGKARNLAALSRLLLERHGGRVPRDRAALEALPGVGRKTANVVLGNAFGVPGITVDTHFGRLTRRWAWTDSEDPVEVEKQVGTLIERKDWTMLSNRVIVHGRGAGDRYRVESEGERLRVTEPVELDVPVTDLLPRWAR